MKVFKIIKEIGDNLESTSFYETGIYLVTLRPNFIERLFGYKQEVVRIKPTTNIYSFGEDRVYLEENGKELSNDNYIVKAIDNYKRKFNIKNK